MNDDEIIHLTELNKDLLHEVLEHGMDGSYYDKGDWPDVEGVGAFYRKESDTITKTQLEQIAEYYGLWGSDLIEIISDVKEYREWIPCRLRPFDDPW